MFLFNVSYYRDMSRPGPVTFFLNVLRGFVIGVANVIPGVSGGTLAVVLGIYERLITSIDRLFRLRTGWMVSGFFVFQVLLGAGIGIVTLAHFMEGLLERYPYGMAFLFMGLILGSIPSLVGQLETPKVSPGGIAAFVVAFAVVAVTSGGAEGLGLQYLPGGFRTLGLFFLSGVAGAAAMVVPGISGSFVLVLLGTYTAVLYAVNNRDLIFLAVLALGALLGVVLVTRLIAYLLRRFHRLTYSAIIGLVAGSVVALWPGMPQGESVLLSLILFVGGAGLALLFGSRNRLHPEETPEPGSAD